MYKKYKTYSCYFFYYCCFGHKRAHNLLELYELNQHKVQVNISKERILVHLSLQKYLKPNRSRRRISLNTICFKKSFRSGLWLDHLAVAACLLSFSCSSVNFCLNLLLTRFFGGTSMIVHLSFHAAWENHPHGMIVPPPCFVLDMTHSGHSAT